MTMRRVHETAPTRRGQYGSDRSGGATVVYPVVADRPEAADPVTATRLARVWPNALHPFASPCRIDPGKGFRQHRCSGSHADVVASYRAWRDGEYAAADEHDAGTPSSPRYGSGEGDDYWSTHARPTFGAYLIMTRGAARC